MEALADANGDLNLQLLAKTRGITLFWYLFSAELDFLFFFIVGFTAISLLYVKQVFLFVLNLLRLIADDKGDDSEDSSDSFEQEEGDCVQEL